MDRQCCVGVSHSLPECTGNVAPYYVTAIRRAVTQKCKHVTQRRPIMPSGCSDKVGAPCCFRSICLFYMMDLQAWSFADWES